MNLNPFPSNGFPGSLDSAMGGLFQGDGIMNAIGSVLSNMIAIFAAFVILPILALLIVSVLYYLYNAFTLLHIGRKAGNSDDLSWMVFVPFAWTIYRLKILRKPWWHMFVFEGIQIYSLIFAAFYLWIGRAAGVGFLIFLLLVYWLGALIYKIFFRYQFLKAFNINPLLVLAMLPALSVILLVLDAFIAFTNLFAFGEGAAVKPPIAGEGPFAKPKPVGRIQCVIGMYAGQVFNLRAGEEMTIGRDSAQVSLAVTSNAAKISRKHVGIVWDEVNVRYIVTDYSSNGTFLEDMRRLPDELPTPLPKGTLIALGTQENSFRLL